MSGPSVDVDYRTELVERFQLDLDRPGKAYSTGNRQKVALVAAFATRAPLLVLDEPTSGLDPLMEREFRRCVIEARERGQTVFLSSHQLAEVEAVCDRVAILRSGRLVEIDSIADLRQLRRTVVEVSFTRCPTSRWTTSQESRISIISTGIGCVSVCPAHPRPLCAPWPWRRSLRWRCESQHSRRSSSTTTARRPDDHRRAHRRRSRSRPPRLGGRSPADLRQVRRGTLVVAAVCAGMSALVAVQYQTTFEGAIDQSGLRALVENPAIRIIFGPPVALDDAGGFTVWRTGTPLLILASVWILLAATRITRGEEDAGRYDLLLAGRLRKVAWSCDRLAALADRRAGDQRRRRGRSWPAGTDATGAIVYAAAVLGVTLTFATGAVLAAQIMPTRSSRRRCDRWPARRGPAGTDACRRRAAACLVSMDDPVRPGRPGRARTQPTGSARCWFSPPFRSRSGWPRW